MKTQNILFNTVAIKRRLEITLVQPGIGTILDTFNDRQGLMLGSNVLLVGIVIVYRWPN